MAEGTPGDLVHGGLSLRSGRTQHAAAVRPRSPHVVALRDCRRSYLVARLSLSLRPDPEQRYHPGRSRALSTNPTCTRCAPCAVCPALSLGVRAAAQLLPSTFATDLWQLRAEGALCDTMFRVGDDAFAAHRAVLAARSSFFKGMFDGPGAVPEVGRQAGGVANWPCVGGVAAMCVWGGGGGTRGRGLVAVVHA